MLKILLNFCTLFCKKEANETKYMPRFINPSDILNQVDLRPTMTAADFGCGGGGITVDLAKRLEQGRVYAIDVQQEMLSALKSRAELAGVRNIKTILADIEQPIQGLPQSSCDAVFVVSVIFEVDENKKAVFDQAKRALKPGGRLVVADWLPDKMSVGPRKGRIGPEEMKNIAKQTGLQLEKEFRPSDYHYGLVFRKE